MGGDFGPPVTVPAVEKALHHHSNLKIILVGDEAKILSYLTDASLLKKGRLSILHTSETISMNEPLASAIRGRPKTSMHCILELLAEKKVDAALSAGNTGALVALATRIVKPIKGIVRPAICTAVPSSSGRSWLLDLGANVDCGAEKLFQFALMGTAVAKAVDGVASPRVALLNIGEEHIKGNAQVKEAAVLLQQEPSLNYIGFVEGHDLYSGKADVIVCDGFVGNVALKASEGVARLVAEKVESTFTRNWVGRMVWTVASPLLFKVKRAINPERFNGACLLGLNGLIIKSHGNASVAAFTHAIEQAMVSIEHQIGEAVANELYQTKVS